jgi:trimeric autotransporter adhesin
VGTNAKAMADGAIAVGFNSSATGVDAIAIGRNSSATGSIAVGVNALASNGGTAIGDNTVATGSNSVALGSGASATHANAAAIGSGATTTRANQVVIGTTSNTYTMPGIQSAASAAAQSGPVQFVTADQQGNLATTNLSQQTINNLINGATNLTNLQNQVAGIQNQVNSLQNDVQKSFEGTAIAIAMSGGWLPDNKIFAIATNLANFQGQNAMSLNAYYRISPNIVVNGGVGAGFQHNGVGSRVGALFAW